MAELDFERNWRSPDEDADRSLTFWLFGVQVVLCIAAVMLEMLLTFVVDACDETCSSSLVAAAGFTSLIGTAAVLLGTALCITGLRSLGRKSWWVPIAGTGAALAVFFASWIVLAIGTQRGLNGF